ncbi:hypothetical protein JVT61DRAFT_1621 [Boletus reticuloceps]|uniref:Uncharacterized protein n=1 Tax=Boletus reticuloceps TaxID=495285 RepID=A0A8I3A9C1_9AGAM|nr:hypothetical protein JVT61DRAFT_1621 [Boletus reticuloceps]
MKSEPVDPPRISSTAAVGGSLTMLSSVASSAGTSTNTPTPGVVSASSSCGTSSSTDVSSVPSSSSVSSSPFAALPASVCLPIVIGPVLSSHPSSGTPEPPPIMLHNNTRSVSQQLKVLEEMGAQKALEVLQDHIIQYLKERMGKKKRKKANANGTSDGTFWEGGMKTGKGDASEPSSLFTTAPLPLRTTQSMPTSQVPVPTSQWSTQISTMETTVSDICMPAIESPAEGPKDGVPLSVDDNAPMHAPVLDDSRSQFPTIVVVDEDEEEGRVAKRRKLGNEAEIETLLTHEGSIAQVP